MAVEASFLPQDRDSLNQEAFWPPYDLDHIRFGSIPCIGTPEPIVQQPSPGFPIGNQPLHRDSLILNSDSCLYASDRKRNRECVLQELYGTSESYFPALQHESGLCVAGVDISPQIQQSQMEMDAIIAQHMKRFRSGFDERQKQYARLMSSAMAECAMKALKEKDEQFQRLVKLNIFLQERAKSLYADNQLLRDLAQTNEAAANSLRSNLEQILLRGGGDERAPGGVDDDAESICSSSTDPSTPDARSSSSRLCRRCRKQDASVLLLPCRHLCLCASCGGGSLQLRSCPVCNCAMNATLHVNTSP